MSAVDFGKKAQAHNCMVRSVIRTRNIDDGEDIAHVSRSDNILTQLRAKLSLLRVSDITFGKIYVCCPSGQLIRAYFENNSLGSFCENSVSTLEAN